MFETNICLKEICLMPLVLSQKDKEQHKVHHSLPKSLPKVLQKMLRKLAWFELCLQFYASQILFLTKCKQEEEEDKQQETSMQKDS
jgi:hypothetical protein